MTTEEPTTPDPVELVRKQFEAGNRRDIDAVVSSFAADAVFDGRALGDHFEGRAAIRGFVEGWFGMYEELAFKLEEVHELGNGVVFAVVVQEARPADIAGHVRQREGWVYVWVDGLISRFTVSDIDGGPCRRRTARRGTGVGGVPGEGHDDRGRHPRRMKWVETCGAAHDEAVYVLALRVRSGEWLGRPWEPRTVAVSTLSRIFEREGSPWAAAVAVEVGGGM